MKMPRERLVPTSRRTTTAGSLFPSAPSVICEADSRGFRCAETVGWMKVAKQRKGRKRRKRKKIDERCWARIGQDRERE